MCVLSMVLFLAALESRFPSSPSATPLKAYLLPMYIPCGMAWVKVCRKHERYQSQVVRRRVRGVGSVKWPWTQRPLPQLDSLYYTLPHECN